jgi:hypothetical protein
MSLALIDAIKQWMDQRQLHQHTALPGCVTAYDPATQLADVQVRIKVGGNPLPILNKIPVGHLRTRHAFIHMPLKPGDFVLVVFNEEHTGTWRKIKGALASAGFQDRHGLNGAVAIPMHYPDDQAIPGLDGDVITIGYDGGTRLAIADSGTLTIHGDLKVTGEVTAKSGSTTTAVKLSTHKHPSGTGPTGSPTPGT